MRMLKIFMKLAAGCFLAGLPAAVHAEDAAGKNLEIRMETDGTNFKGLSRKVTGGKAPELHRQVLRKGFYYIEALDASGRVRRVQTMPASNEVFYDYFDTAEQQDVAVTTGSAPSKVSPQAAQVRPLKGGKLIRSKANFTLKMPYDAEIKTLRIHILKDSPAPGAHRISGPQQAAPQQAPAGRELKATIDLDAIPEEQ